MEKKLKSLISSSYSNINELNQKINSHKKTYEYWNRYNEFLNNRKLLLIKLFNSNNIFIFYFI